MTRQSGELCRNQHIYVRCLLPFHFHFFVLHKKCTGTAKNYMDKQKNNKKIDGQKLLMKNCVFAYIWIVCVQCECFSFSLFSFFFLCFFFFHTHIATMHSNAEMVKNASAIEYHSRHMHYVHIFICFVNEMHAILFSNCSNGTQPPES